MRSRANIRLSVIALGLVLITMGLPAPVAHATSTCGNAIACENQLPGTPQSVWDPGTDDQTILGYATQMSVNLGGAIDFKINTVAHAYTIDIYRLGYYQGNGARKIASIPVTATLPQSQPACLRDVATDLFDCGNWAVSSTWQVPATAVSGVYFALLTRADTGGQSQIPFVVRNDASHSDTVFQTSDTTWQAYNTYGGANLYVGVNQPRGYKVSYNRPFVDRDGVPMRDYVYANEYPTIRFLESNGVDVSYISGLDIAMGQGHLTNHKVYMSVGHDEYWSQPQRDAVTQARDAGVNLMFLSGNEVFWRTRWESSIDGTNTPFRTMVCYKDTRADTQIDPVTPTPTWRDARFAGFAPENSLTGTEYMMQGTSVPLQVTSDQGKLRLWRNTSLANLSPGTAATVASDLVGYEADEQVDNGFGPPGEIALSTTVANVNEILQDFGLVAAPGTLTHHFSEYRAASGALVFGAGTIQYGWGLDGTHDLSTHGAIPAIQQLTINVLADMGVQPTTLQSGLVAATASVDLAAPVVTITQPAASSIALGTNITVSGTATDAGGAVAGVEVTVDGGASWHAATGTYNWSYTAPLRSYSASAIQVRASDDSLNTSAPVSASGITVTGPTMLFGDWTPPNTDSGDSAATTLGVSFVPNSDGFVNGVRFYKSAANIGTHTGTLYTSTGTALATGTFTGETATGWQLLTFTTPVPVNAGSKYVIAYYAPVGHYAYGDYFFAARPFATGPLTAPGGLGVANGVYGLGATFPALSWHQANYWVDVVYTLAANAPLGASAVSPVSGAGSVLTGSTVVGRFNRDPGDTTEALTLTAAGGVQVPGTSSYNSSTSQVTFTPAQQLAYGTTFTATVSDALLATPYSWSFSTVGAPRVPGQCPCTLLQDTDQPTTVATTDLSNLSVGVAFTPATSGMITAIRYWKSLGAAGGNPVALYGPTGIALGSATATSETTVGWQTATFATPVSVTANVTYTAAAQYVTGAYPYAYGKYTSAQTVGPLSTPASAGRYVYGGGYPGNASTSGYFVDPVFMLAGTPVPTVTSASPGNGARSVPLNVAVTATFNETIAAGTGTVTLTGPSGAVPGTVTGTDTTRTFTPSSALADSTSYVFSVTGAATVDGIVQTQAYSETFTTSGLNACPCSLLETTLAPQLPNLSNGSGLTLGLKFTPAVNGSITGLRYWRAATNTGTHTGKLYSANGAVLATVTFVDGVEGWQQASFSTPVGVTAGATYIAAYYSPTGAYSATTNVFTTPMSNPPLASVDSGGVFGSGNIFPNQFFGAPNYFVDVVFTTQTVASPPPAVLSASPGNGARSVPVNGSVAVTFNEAITAGTGAVTLTGPSGAVAGTVAETSSTRTFTPSSALAPATVYTVTVTGATTSDGVVQAQAYSETFTTSGPTACPCSLLETTLTPQQPNLSNGSGLTLGLKFTPTVNGFIQGLRYWRAAPNTGTHTGKLYAADGTVLANLTFVDGAEGWQQASFSAAVAVTAGTTYYASYYSPVGTYSATTNAFTTGMSNPPLASVDPGGVFAAGDAFPTQSFSGTNYFVDVVFTTTVGVPSVASVAPAASATGVAVTSPVTVTFAGPLNPSSVSVTVTGPGGAVAGTLAVNAPTATFTPSAALAQNAVYTVTVAAASTDGTAMTPFSSTFTTASTVSVASTTPAASATSVALASTVGVTFAGALTPSSVVVTVTPSGGAPVAGTLATTATTATFTPSAALVESTVYTATVNASSASGTAMAPYTWTFGTLSPAPVIASRTPVANATGVAANSTVQMSFTKAVDPTKSTFSLVNASGVAVAGALVKTTTSVTFTPSAVLAANTKYTATVGASSLLGTAMTPAVWSFTTETAPTVSAITPANGATAVTNTTTVKATFSKAVTTASISVTVTDPSGTAIAGTLATTTTTGTFTPTALLTPGTLYRVTVSAALADGLASTPFTSSFTTGAAASIFPASLTPASSTTSASPLTVGVKFRATTAYSITGIRFYLPANWTSTYTVTLWSSTGTKLATASGSPTSATAGWRTVNLTTPVRTTANTTYVASVRALNTQYSSTPLAFLLQYTNGTFTVPASGGVTSSTDVFPTASSLTNYFVDVVGAP